jgi:hypothetical protein
MELALDEAELAALRDIVYSFINEGFDHPPYTPEQYTIFEKVGIDPDDEMLQYDIRRPER